MKIVLNGEYRSFEGSSLGDLLEELALGMRMGIAVAVNEKVVPREGWAQTPLKDEDSVLVITATQGG